MRLKLVLLSLLLAGAAQALPLTPYIDRWVWNGAASGYPRSYWVEDLTLTDWGTSQTWSGYIRAYPYGFQFTSVVSTMSGEHTFDPGAVYTLVFGRADFGGSGPGSGGAVLTETGATIVNWDYAQGRQVTTLNSTPPLLQLKVPDTALTALLLGIAGAGLWLVRRRA